MQTAIARRPISSLPAWLADGRTLAIACGLAILAMQVELVFAKSVNWDEFFGFGQIHQWLCGEPVPVLQVPYVYLFGWVPRLPGGAIDHILAIRALILPFELLTAAVIFDLARRFASRNAALLAALAYIGGGHVFLHAFALRADMIAASLLMGVLWVVLTRPLRSPALAGAALLFTLAMIATIKSVLYAPAILAALWWRRDSLPLRLLIPAAAVAAGLGLVALVATGASGPLFTMAASSAERMFDGGLFPQGGYLADQLLTAPILTIMLLAGAVILWQRCLQALPFLAACLVPLLAVAIYRNAFPYYYVFALPPAMIIAAAGADWMQKRYGLAPVAAVLAINALALSLSEDRQVLHDQHTVHAGIAEIFPEPVTYIDDAAFVGPFPRAVHHFASGWGLSGYRAARQPSYRMAMEQRVVPFLLREGPAMENFDPARDGELMLLGEDTAALRDNYIRHWGKVFVAGKRIGPGIGRIEVLVPGTYTVEGSAVTVDDRTHAPGRTVVLQRGEHAVSAQGTATLRWGNHLPRPAFAWPDGALYTNY
ncbi:hypothetical protein QQS45_00365 [Alteriqipengyuania flavescens]|uniref:hypothetical protein n=1 Tax=Alteriqipengyuania flavescens TaxID=3053610 RepID=UPI0025B31EAD|nr:hypothetical protein [Alteriqipengyuania flavescens]WJY18743.1 hypothetical protein QQW98_00365 [Alteriqipengyuania flavescens]WJY24683.1 hypothetical protein QQS45_00365 [Alteriqipengyuania flavescens]